MLHDNLLCAWATSAGPRRRRRVLEASEVGKSYQGQEDVGERAIYFAGPADWPTGDTLLSATPKVLGMTLREPNGVFSSIVPWNGPSGLPISDKPVVFTAGQ